MAVVDYQKKPYRKQFEADIMNEFQILNTGKNFGKVVAINDLGSEAASGHPLLHDDDVEDVWQDKE